MISVDNQHRPGPTIKGITAVAQNTENSIIVAPITSPDIDSGLALPEAALSLRATPISTALYLSVVIAIFVSGFSYLHFYEIVMPAGEISYAPSPPGGLVILSSIVGVLIAGILISPTATPIGLTSFVLMNIIGFSIWPLSPAPFGSG